MQSCVCKSSSSFNYNYNYLQIKKNLYYLLINYRNYFAKKSHKNSRSTNKVWLASDSSDAKPTTAVSLPPRRLSGHELKTRQGNRQWVSKRVRRSVHFSQPSSSSSAAVTASMPPLGTPVRHTGPASNVATLFRHPARRLSGYELKTRHGNKQWVSKRMRRSLQLVPANYSRAAAVFGAGAPVQRRKGRVGGRGLFNQLVSLSGQKFVVDSGGHRMKRVLSFSSSSTSSPLFPRPRLRSRGRSTAESSHSAVKHYLARYCTFLYRNEFFLHVCAYVHVHVYMRMYMYVHVCTCVFVCPQPSRAAQQSARVDCQAEEERDQAVLYLLQPVWSVRNWFGQLETGSHNQLYRFSQCISLSPQGSATKVIPALTYMIQTRLLSAPSENLIGQSGWK